MVRRQYGAHQRANSVLPGQVHHTDDIGESQVFLIRAALVDGDIIDTCQNNHVRCLDINDILTEADEHLGAFLPADTPADKTGGGKEFGAVIRPGVGDGVSEEHHAGATGGLQGGIVGRITVQMDPYLGRCHGPQ